MDIVSSVSSATVQADMNSSPYESSEHEQLVFKTPETPLNNALTVKPENKDSALLNSQISSPHSVHSSNSPLSDPFISSTSSDNNDFNVFSNGQNFSSFSSVSCAQSTISPIDSLENKTGLDQLLTCTVSANMIPRMGSPQDSLISSPVNGSDTILSSPGGNDTMEPTNTEYTLIDQAGRFNINDGEPNQFESVRFGQEPDHDFQQLLDYVVTDSDSCKVPKMRRDSDAPSSINKEDVTVDKLFEADLANSTAEFSFNKFGSEVQPGIFTFGGKNISGAETTSTNATLVVTSAVSTAFEIPKTPEIKTNITPVTRSQRGGRHLKEPNLCQQYSSRTDKYELRILEQPEEQHRARYLTEGSRGAIKNVSQEGNPVVKLFGDVEHATLQVFIGNDQGRVKPHAFYQACKVCGKNSTPCQEREIEGTVVIEMEMDTVNDKTCSIDNVGILKLRNADVENRVGIQKAKKKSTKARLIFRVQFQKPDGNIQILQVSSRSINCTQPIGQPEICKMSLRESSVNGNVELIMIGKNFMKGTKVFFQEISGEDGPVVWEKESEIDKDYFQPTHLVCTVPAYRDTCVTSKVNAQVVVRCSGKQSEPQTFAFTPVFQIKQETTPMETDEHVQQNQKQSQGPLNITVAPEALRLNQQLQESLASSRGKFMLPDGAVSGITSMQVDQAEDTEEKQSKESGTYQTSATSFNNQNDNENQQCVLSSVEQQTSVQHQSEFQTGQSEQCPFSMPKSSVENSGINLENSGINVENSVINVDTSDLHSILNSLDDKPMSLHDILSQNPTETLNTNTGQSLNQVETSFSKGTSIGPESASFSVANNNQQTVDLANSNATFSIGHMTNDVSNHQQTVSSSIFNNLSESSVAGFKTIVTNDAIVSENFAANIQVDQQNFQQNVTSPTKFSEVGNVQTNQQNHHEFGNIQNSSQNIHDFGNNQINPPSIQEYHTEMHTSQTQQIIVENIPAQSHIGHFQQHNVGNIQTQQNVSALQSPPANIGNLQSQQQSFGNIQQGVEIMQQQNVGQIQQQQTIGQIQQQSVGQIQPTNIGQIQQQQQNVGQIQTNIGQIQQQQQNVGQIQQQNIAQIKQQQNIGQIQQQNIGQVQQDIGQVQQQQQQNIGHIQQSIGQIQQQQEFQVNFNNSQEMGNTFQPLQAYPDVSNIQPQTPVTGNLQNKLTNDQVPVAIASNTNTTTEQIGYSDVAMRLLQQLLTTSKSTDSSNTDTNSFVNSAQNVNNTMYTATATPQQASPSVVQANPFPQNLATPILQQTGVATPTPQPNVTKPSQGILHQMLSQDLDVKPPEFNTTASAFVSNGQPAVQQLDSLRLQAMAQQVQQQAQLAQNPQPTPNGNPARGPQIIVLGGGGLTNPPTNQTNTSAAAAPSILILPGGGGDNNNTPNNPQSHVENILRSILGSLKPESQ